VGADDLLQEHSNLHLSVQYKELVFNGKMKPDFQMKPDQAGNPLTHLQTPDSVPHGSLSPCESPPNVLLSPTGNPGREMRLI
jgi:hypothetical protein